jgi:ABC-type iron transport system FetAB ATPase subunit
MATPTPSPDRGGGGGGGEGGGVRARTPSAGGLSVESPRRPLLQQSPPPQPGASPLDRGLTLRLDGLDVALPSGRLVLAGVALTLPPGGRAFVVGPSGAGKSRLLRAVAGLDPPPPRRGAAGGSVLTLGGRPPEEWSLPAWRAWVLYLPPAPAGAAAAAGGGGGGGRRNNTSSSSSTHPGPGGPTPAGLLDAARALASQRARPGGGPSGDAAARSALTSAATALLLDPACLDAPWATLSSGQAARAALAVALALAPPVLVLDEPTAALDGAAVAAAEAVLAACGSALLWVTHDPGQPGRVAGAGARVYRVIPGAGPGGAAGLVEEEGEGGGGGGGG